MDGENVKTTEWQCPFCNRYLSTKHRLASHLNKKTPCSDKKTIEQPQINHNEKKKIPGGIEYDISENGKKRYKCRYCDKTYSAKNSVYTHMKKSCTQNPARMENIITDNSNTIVNTTHNNTNNTDNSTVNNINNSTTNNNIDNSVNNNILNQNFNLEKFGKEPTDDRHIYDVVTQLEMSDSERYARLTSLRNRNPDIPENHNVCIPDLKQPRALVYDDTGFHHLDVNTVVYTMLSKNLFAFADYGADDMNERLTKKLDQLIEYGNAYVRNRMPPEERAKLINDQKLALYDNTDNVLIQKKEYEEYMELKRQKRKIKET